MIQSQAGFILKRFQPNKLKTSVLSMHDGKIDLSFKKFNDCFKLWPGMLISFNTEQMHKTLFGLNTQILACPNLSQSLSSSLHENVSPSVPATQSIFVMHHILELCYFFTPNNKPCPEIFNFLKQFFLFFENEKFEQNHLKLTHANLAHIKLAQINLAQKIFVTKLFSLFGFFSHEPISTYLAAYETLTTTFIDFSIEQKVEFWETHLSCYQEKNLDEWILESLKIHPHSYLFKTTVFIYKH